MTTLMHLLTPENRRQNIINLNQHWGISHPLCDKIKTKLLSTLNVHTIPHFASSLCTLLLYLELLLNANATVNYFRHMISSYTLCIRPYFSTLLLDPALIVMVRRYLYWC